jgi:hypothetical protein
LQATRARHFISPRKRTPSIARSFNFVAVKNRTLTAGTLFIAMGNTSSDPISAALRIWPTLKPLPLVEITAN